MSSLSRVIFLWAGGVGEICMKRNLQLTLSQTHHRFLGLSYTSKLESGILTVPRNWSTPRKLRCRAVRTISAVFPCSGINSSHSSCQSTSLVAFSFTDVWYFSLPSVIVTKQSLVSAYVHSQFGVLLYDVGEDRC